MLNKNTFHIPILFLIFNRPDTTQQVFNKIKEIRPSFLFVAADGPREGKNEDKKCEAARAIIKQVDWDCDLRTSFSEKNLGCKKAVSSGINWFFKNVEKGIILEDDCLPDLSFFTFCSQMLEKYRTDDRIMHIGGTNFQDGVQRGMGSYYFSRLVHVWGWATWRRAWEKYDLFIKSFPRFIEQNYIQEIFPDKKQQQYWIRNFKSVYDGGEDTWDFQWVYSVFINNGLSVIPNRNLVTNLGFGVEATHTTLAGNPLGGRNIENLGDIIDPDFFIISRSADDYTFNKYLSPGKINKLLQLIR
jgi:hypothetical protein